MKCLILAAGYATRLYPLTENFPKPLLEVGGKAILDWLIDDISQSSDVDGFIVVSNHKFADIFRKWAPKCVTVVDDGTSSNETRLGAVRDILFAVGSLGIDDDLLVIAGDNLLDFSLGSFISYFDAKRTSCILRYREPVAAKLSRSGVVEVDADDLVLSMQEKPQQPKSEWCCPPFYCYTRGDLKLIPKAMEEGCGVDAPGSFVSWLCARVPLHAMEMPGSRYDIGNLDSYRQVQASYRGIKQI